LIGISHEFDEKLTEKRENPRAGDEILHIFIDMSGNEVQLKKVVQYTSYLTYLLQKPIL